MSGLVCNTSSKVSWSPYRKRI